MQLWVLISRRYVTSQGERVPQSMEIQHSQANRPIIIKGDMSTLMKNIENFI